MARHSFKIPPDLAPLVHEFSQWRRTRPSPRSRLPDDLMAKARAATQNYTAAVVARSVGLVASQLSLSASSSVAVATSQAPAVGAQALVRLAPVIGLHHADQTPAVVEFEAPNGWRLRLSGGDAAGAVKTFMEALR